MNLPYYANLGLIVFGALLILAGFLTSDGGKRDDKYYTHLFYVICGVALALGGTLDTLKGAGSVWTIYAFSAVILGALIAVILILRKAVQDKNDKDDS